LRAVPRDASDEDVRRAYRFQAQALHPDKHTSAALREVRGSDGGRAVTAARLVRFVLREQ
jgi:curved DNA-binding protein CbpA